MGSLNSTYLPRRSNQAATATAPTSGTLPTGSPNNGFYAGASHSKLAPDHLSVKKPETAFAKLDISQRADNNGTAHFSN